MSRSRSSAIIGTSSALISAKIRVTSADFVSGSKSSRRMSYGSSVGSKHAMYLRRSSTARSSAGRKSSKFDVAFASSQIGAASAPARAISAESSGGHAHGLVVLAAREPDHARVVRVGIERLLERAQLLDQAADLRVDQRLVAELLEQREVPAAARRSGRRHGHAQVPGEESGDRSERVDRLEAGLQVCEGVGHRPGTLAIRIGQVPGSDPGTCPTGT